MFELHVSSVANWAKHNQFVVPSAVDLNCSFCGKLVCFNLPRWQPGPNDIYHADTKCPSCQKRPRFLLIEPVKARAQFDQSSHLFVWPWPKARRPIESVAETLSAFSSGLRDAYISAVNVLNAEEWPSATVSCRRLLEGIVKHVLPPDKQTLPLSKQLEALPEHRNLAEPILTLAHGVRKGGNLGAHFDLEKTPNEETATMMLELLEELMQYLFVLPSRIDELHEGIKKLGD